MVRSKRQGKKGEDVSWEDIAKTVQVTACDWTWTYVLGHSLLIESRRTLG